MGRVQMRLYSVHMKTKLRLLYMCRNEEKEFSQLRRAWTLVTVANELIFIGYLNGS